MTKQELEQYRSIVAEIDEVRERLNNNIVSDTVVGSSRHYPFTSHVMRVEGIGDKATAERDTLLLENLKRQKQDIEEFVTAIPDSLTRRIFRLRYIQGKHKPSWTAIAISIGGGNTRSGVQKRHERFLKNI